MANMGDKSLIAWTDASWNPATGCSKVSQGCKNCYAEREWPRMQHLPAYTGRAFTDVLNHPERLTIPLHWAKPRRIFVNSMSDLFHEDVPDGFIDQVFAVMALSQRHVFQVLTKRAERMLHYMATHCAGGRYVWSAGQKIAMPRGQHKPNPGWPLPNVWLGVSCEDQETADERIPLLLQTPAAVRWISAEPLLGPIDLTRIDPDAESLSHVDVLRGAYFCDGLNEPRSTPHLDWVVAGGESGPKARSMNMDWARSLRDQCLGAWVPFFMKQLSSRDTKFFKDFELFPRDLQIREYPERNQQE